MSEVLEPAAAPELVRALAGLGELLDRVAVLCRPGPEGSLWQLQSAEVLAATAVLHGLTHRADAAVHALVGEVDSRGAAVEAGAPSTASWLLSRLRVHPGHARRIVATATGLHTAPGGGLVDHQGPAPASDMADTDAADTEGGHTAYSGSGWSRVRTAFAAGTISGEHAGIVCHALAALPDGLDPGIADEAEAYLVERAGEHDPLVLARLARHLAHVLDPEAGDTLGDEEETDRSRQSLEITVGKNGGSRVCGRLGAELTAALLAQIQPLAAPAPRADGQPDLRSLGARNADALAELLRRAAAAGTGPSRHGSRASITITMPLDTLRQRLGARGADLDWSGPISAATARRLACDAQIIPVVLGSPSEPLDVGRASYPVTHAIWRALVVRDRGCAFAGCLRPPEWTEAHHLRHWADGGTTTLPNLALLCDHHHRSVHHHGWTLHLDHGVINTIPPPWIDPHRTPRPNTPPPHLAA